MAYSTYGKKVYASIKDLPQYTSLGNGDKLIIWNETRDGAAVVDYADLMIDLDHVSFQSTISEMVTLASDIQTYVHTTTEEIEGLSESLNELENVVTMELRPRIKALEYLIAIMLGSNSYWLSSTGLENIRNKILVEGISAGGIEEDGAETDEEKEALKWFEGLMSVIRSYISKMTPGVSTEDILMQSKFRYKYTDITPTASIDSSSVTATTTTIETTSKDASGATTSTTTTTINHS